VRGTTRGKEKMIGPDKNAQRSEERTVGGKNESGIGVQDQKMNIYIRWKGEAKCGKKGGIRGRSVRGERQVNTNDL